jgi:hypothetical protein
MSKFSIPKLPRLPAALQRKLKFDLKEIDKKSPLDGSHLAWRDSVDKRKEALNEFRVAHSDERPSGLFDRFTGREISTPADWEALVNDPDTIDFVGFKEALNYVVLTYIAVEDAYVLEWKQTNKSSYEQLEKLLLLIKAEAIRRGLEKCTGYGEDWFNRRVLPYANAEIDARVENRCNWARDVEKQRLTEAALSARRKRSSQPAKPAPQPPRQKPLVARRTVWEGIPPPLDIPKPAAVEPIRTELPSGRQIPPISVRLAHDPISEDVDPQSPPSSPPQPLAASDEQPTPSEPDKPQESPSNALPQPEEIIEDSSAPVTPLNEEIPSPPEPPPAAEPVTEASRIAEAAARREAVVRPILTNNGWTVSEWALRAGVDFHTADDYLKGRTKLQPSKRKQLAEVLGLKAEQLPL